MDYFPKVCCLAVLENFVCNKVYFKIVPRILLEAMKLF